MYIFTATSTLFNVHRLTVVVNKPKEFKKISYPLCTTLCYHNSQSFKLMHYRSKLTFNNTKYQLCVVNIVMLYIKLIE